MTSFYTVYLTTNTVNSRFYIGVHKTTNPNDRYLGSGLALKNAIKKYGRKVFVKKVLHSFKTSSEAYSKEKELVTTELIGGGETYNLAIGGVPSINWPKGDRARTALRAEAHPMWGSHNPEANARRSEGLKKAYREKPRDPITWKKSAEKRRGGTTSLKGSKQSPELVAKRAEAMKNIPKRACPHCAKMISPSNLKNHSRVHSV